MARHYHSQFETRQHMATSDFEIFYYEDKSSPMSLSIGMITMKSISFWRGISPIRSEKMSTLSSTEISV